ncbi:unnamed protein product [Prunus armeniaca]
MLDGDHQHSIRWGENHSAIHPASNLVFGARTKLVEVDYHFTIELTCFSSRQAFTYANWVGCPIDQRSTSGWCIYLGSNLISWSAKKQPTTKKQPTVSRSSTKAEYGGLAMTAAELLYLSKLFKDIGFQLPSPPLLWCDN